MRIALIEDDQNLSELFAEVFTFEGYEVITASAEGCALATVRDSRPDLILVDLSQRGSRLVQTLRTVPRTAVIPLVVCYEDRMVLQQQAPWLQSEGISTVPHRHQPSGVTASRIW